jgi:hypothetical protein
VLGLVVITLDHITDSSGRTPASSRPCGKIPRATFDFPD